MFRPQDRATCPSCGKRITVRYTGQLSTHRKQGERCPGSGKEPRKDRGPTTEAEMPW